MVSFVQSKHYLSKTSSFFFGFVPLFFIVQVPVRFTSHVDNWSGWWISYNPVIIQQERLNSCSIWGYSRLFLLFVFFFSSSYKDPYSFFLCWQVVRPIQRSSSRNFMILLGLEVFLFEFAFVPRLVVQVSMLFTLRMGWTVRQPGNFLVSLFLSLICSFLFLFVIVVFVVLLTVLISMLFLVLLVDWLVGW